MAAAAWIITIGLFITGFYLTSVIMNGLKEKEQQELAMLESQLASISVSNTEIGKKAV